MWILPVDLSALHVELTSGPHLLPSCYTGVEIDRLSWLLRGTVAGVRSEVRLDRATLESLANRRVTVPDALVVARFEGPAVAVDEVNERVKALGARCALIQLPEPQEAGYGWLEREVKAPLYRAIGAWLKQPGHPLSVFHPEALPVIEAAGLTTDPVELIDLLERSVAHRIRYADVGCDEAAYRRSLFLTAGERLAERLAGLEQQALQAAVEILFSEGRGPASRERFLAGTAALVRVGLATRVAGDLRLGPLARSIRERELLGAFESKLAGGAWTEESRRLSREMRRQRLSAEASVSAPIEVVLPSAGAVGGGGTTVEVAFPIDALRELAAEVFPGDAAVADAVSLLEELVRQPRFPMTLEEPLQDWLVRALRALETSASSTIPRQREVGSLLSGLLQLVAARGADAAEAQAAPLRRILDASEQLSTAWAEDLRLVALFWSAVTRLRFLRHAGDLEAAARTLEECASTWTAGERRIAIHLGLSEIAMYREDPGRAREHCEEALRLAIAGAHRSHEAAAQLALAQVALGESRHAEAEHWAEKARASFEDVDDARSAAAARSVLGYALYAQGRIEEARGLLTEALATFIKLGDIVQRVETALPLGSLLREIGDVRMAESLANETRAAAESAGLPVSTALALIVEVLALTAKGDHDGALVASERAHALLQSTGVYPSSSEKLLGLVQAQRSLHGTPSPRTAG